MEEAALFWLVTQRGDSGRVAPGHSCGVGFCGAVTVAELKQLVGTRAVVLYERQDAAAWRVIARLQSKEKLPMVSREGRRAERTTCSSVLVVVELDTRHEEMFFHETRRCHETLDHSSNS